MSIFFFDKAKIINKNITKAFLNRLDYSSLKSEEVLKILVDVLEDDSFYKNTKKATEYVSALCYLSRLHLGMSPYSGQILNTTYLLYGYCTEVDTGEGKSLSIAMAALCQVFRYPGHQIHVVTANDYLSERDFHNHSNLFSANHISVSYVPVNADADLRKKIYGTHVVYGSVRALAADFLNDKLIYNREDLVQVASKKIALVDEMDYICLDAAKTPIVISAHLADQEEMYLAVYSAVNIFSVDDYEFEKNTNYIGLSESGIRKLEIAFEIENLFDPENSRLLSLVNSALRAIFVLKSGHEYIVQNDKIGVVDPFLGRVVENRRFIDGVQQFLEIKEALPISTETVPVSSISIPYYLKTYAEFSGTSGTLMFDKIEIYDTYKKNVLRINSDHVSSRVDNKDIISITKEDKIKIFVDFIKERHEVGQPILIGAKSVEQSVEISNLLKSNNISHSVINATNHHDEANILAKAGTYKAVTVATVMAGRGVDIILDNKSKSCGLCVVGLEHFELRRQDAQLRGRCGRQGDPGTTQFFMSIDEEIGEHEIVKNIRSRITRDGFDLSRLKVLTRALESLQAQREVMAYMQRKQLLAFEEITNKQKMVMFAFRDSVLKSNDLSFLRDLFLENLSDKNLFEFLKKLFPDCNLEKDPLPVFDQKVDSLMLEAQRALESLEGGENSKVDSQAYALSKIKQICLSVVDQHYKNFVYEMSLIEDGLEWRKKASRDVYREIYIETYDRFVVVFNSIKVEILASFFKIKFQAKNV